MTVPVLWVSRHEGILARGYADQGMLEAFFDRRIWTPPLAYEYEHQVVTDQFPNVGGAVVVLPGRHHASEDDVRWVLRQLDRLEWSVLIITSEEEWAFDWRALPDDDPTRKLWVMQPRPEHEHVSWKLPCGWYDRTRELLRESAEPGGREYDWFFGGQVTHIRRQQCVEVLRELERPGHLQETEGYFQGGDLGEYLAREARARVVACPSGPESLCTARVEEALEAGCVPIVDMIKPKDPQFNYWQLVFGADCPLRGVDDWAHFPAVLEQELAAWPANVNRVFSWWQQWKRATAHKLDADVRAASAAAGAELGVVAGPNDVITVIVPTSPVPGHPSTADLETTVRSIRDQLPTAEVIIVCDGVRPEQLGRRAQYEEYVRQVTWLCNYEWHNVVPVVLPEWGHQANAARRALELVATPLVLFVEHDTPLVGLIDWSTLSQLVLSGEANAVRFHMDVEIHEDHEPGMLGPVEHKRVDFDEIPDWDDEGAGHVGVRRTKVWWQRPHLASTKFYRERIVGLLPPESRTMIEDPIYGIMKTEIDLDESAWWDWRVWVYTPEGDEVLGIKRSSHLDSRGDDPKFEMWWK